MKHVRVHFVDNDGQIQILKVENVLRVSVEGDGVNSAVRIHKRTQVVGVPTMRVMHWVEDEVEAPVAPPPAPLPQDNNTQAERDKHHANLELKKLWEQWAAARPWLKNFDQLFYDEGSTELSCIWNDRQVYITAAKEPNFTFADDREFYYDGDDEVRVAGKLYDYLMRKATDNWRTKP